MTAVEEHELVLSWFDFPELTGSAGKIAAQCGDLALAMLSSLPDGPERKNGLDRLLEARDWFVRAARRAARLT